MYPLSELNRSRAVLSSFQCMRQSLVALKDCNDDVKRRKNKIRSLARALEYKYMTETASYSATKKLFTRALVRTQVEMEKALEEGAEMDAIAYEDLKMKFASTISFLSSSFKMKEQGGTPLSDSSTSSSGESNHEAGPSRKAAKAPNPALFDFPSMLSEVPKVRCTRETQKSLSPARPKRRSTRQKKN